MRVHHINCGTMCPLTGRMVCHCLVVETNDGLLLVETGLGTEDVLRSTERLRGIWRRLARPALSLDETALSQVRRLGFTADDVRHIIVSHLDRDHAGGIPDFPNATVHLHTRELADARTRPTRLSRARYLPEHISAHRQFQTYGQAGERWFGFEGIRALADTDAEVLLIPLPGHTWGHIGVAVHDGQRRLLHCGDAYFHHHAITGRRTPLPLALFEFRMQTHGRTRRHNVARLAELAREHSDQVILFNAHDATLFERTLFERTPDDAELAERAGPNRES